LKFFSLIKSSKANIHWVLFSGTKYENWHKMNRDLLDLKFNLNLIFRFDKYFKTFFESRTQKAVSVCQLKLIINKFTVMAKQIGKSDVKS